MNTLIFAVLASLAVFASAKPSGHWGDHWGGWDDGHWGGDWDDGSWHGDWDDGSWHGGWGGGHHDVVVGNGAVSVGASAAHHGGWGHGGWGGHGVAVVGPHTASAAIVGPGHTGKVVAHGLWGVGHGHHGHLWRK